MKLSLRLNPYTAIILASIIWGATIPIMKITLDSVPIFTLAFIRFFAAALILFFFVRKNLKIETKDISLLLIAGLSGVSFNIYFFFQGVQFTSALNTGILAATSPILTIIFAHIFLKEKTTRKLLLAGLLGIIGIVIILYKDFSNGISLSPIGDLLILLSVGAFIVNEITSKKLFKNYSSHVVTFYCFLIGAGTFFLPALMENIQNPSWVYTLSPMSLFGIVYGILFSSLIAYELWQYGLANVDASKASIFLNLEPITTIILSVTLLSETITLSFIGGSLFILYSVYLVKIKSHQKR